MARVTSNGIVVFDSPPVDIPEVNQPTFGRLVDTNTFFYWSVDTWITIKIGDDTAYNATTWNDNKDIPTKNAVYNQLEAMLAQMPEAQYFAVLDQTGGSAPTEEEEHSNTLGVTPTFGRPSGAGTYTITALMSFPLGRTNIQLTQIGVHKSIEVQHTSASVFTITVKDASDDISLNDLEGKLSVAIQVFRA